MLLMPRVISQVSSSADAVQLTYAAESTALKDLSSQARSERRCLESAKSFRFVADAAFCTDRRRTGYWAPSNSYDKQTERYNKVHIWCGRRRALATASTNIHSTHTQRAAFAPPCARTSALPLRTPPHRLDTWNIT